MAKVSIVIPVYNSEKYLKKSIEYLLQQTLRDIEIILIDDGSTDNSPNICDEIAKSDNRVIVKHTKNRGICDARNLGVKQASSKYIMFMDNDDKVDISMCKKCYETIEKNNADMLKFGTKTIFIKGDSVQREETRRFENRILNKEDLQKEKMDLFYNQVFDCVWDGIYKKEILVEFNNKLKQGGEDYLFGLNIYSKLNKIVLINEVYYFHCMRKGISTSTKFRKNLLEDEKLILKEYKKVLGNEKQIDVNKYNMRFLRYFMGPILVYFSNEKCKMTEEQKIIELKELRKELKPRSNILKLMKLSFKHALLYLLIKMKMYKTTLNIVKRLFT